MSQIKQFFIWVIVLIQSSKVLGPRLDYLLFWWYRVVVRYVPDIKRLSVAEKEVLDLFLVILLGTDVKRKPKKHIFALVGEPGSGKSKTAFGMSCRIDMGFVSPNEVRVELRNRKLGYQNIQEICNILTFEMVRRGFSMILDSDHIDPFKRARLKAFLAHLGVRPQFVRVTCDDTVAKERIIKGTYGPDSLYDEESPQLKGVRGAQLFLQERDRQIFMHKDKQGKLRPLWFLSQTVDTSHIKE